MLPKNNASVNLKISDENLRKSLDGQGNVIRTEFYGFSMRNKFSNLGLLRANKAYISLVLKNANFNLSQNQEIP